MESNFDNNILETISEQLSTEVGIPETAEAPGFVQEISRNEEVTEKGNYTLEFLFLLAMIALGFLFSILIRRLRKKSGGKKENDNKKNIYMKINDYIDKSEELK